MFARLLRTAITFAAVTVAYQVYVLLAVPRLEPPLVIRAQRESTAAERDRGRKLVDKYQQLLAEYFPAEHWSQQRPPKVIKTGPAMLVLDDYRQPQIGQVELVRCAILFFPTPAVEGQPAPRDAIVVEAHDGAVIEFDEGFNPASGRLGKIVGGALSGLITIRSEMSEPGTHDDLFVQTSNLKLQEDRIETPDPVKFRLGPNQGQGRRMEIRLLEEQQADGAGSGIQFTGVRSLEILQDVRFQLHLDADNLVRREQPADEVASAAFFRPADATDPPVEISCTGPFEFLFAGEGDAESPDYVATFRDNVEVWQFNPNGPSDQMTCKVLSLQFAPLGESAAGASLDTTQRQRQELGRLKPYLLEATGAPVIMVSPARQIDARGSRVRITIPERKIALDGGDVRLTSGRNVLRAPAIFYTHPAAQERTRLGNFLAEGAGSLDFVPNPGEPGEVLRAQWQQSVRLTRDQGKPCLWLDGRPRLAMTGRGELVADEMKIYLEEVAPGDGMALNGDADESTVRPDRLSAIGTVIIQSPQLTGRTHELSAWFRYHSPSAKQDGADSESGNRDRFALPNEQDGGEAYDIQADLVRLEMALRGRRAEPANLACDGNVVFREVRTKNPGEGPLVLHGQRLTVENIDKSARIAVLGAPEGAPATERNRAEMTARGVTLLGRAVYVDEGENRAWIDGGGEAHLKLNRDLQGQPTASAYPVKIRWRDGLNFDGRQIQLEGDVFAEGPDDWLRSDRMVATLTREIDFGKSVDRSRLDLAVIDCQGRVVLDHRARDAGGPTSHERMEIAQVAVNQQSGAISGSGPGWVRSVHYAAAMNSLAGAGAAPAGGGQRLHFLRVNFQQGLAGNMQQRQLSFQGRVRTVYGPVDAWEQQLDPDRPETLPPTAIALRCGELSVSEDPAARFDQRAGNPLSLGGPASNLGPVELVARGNVLIQGRTEKLESFEATAQRASFAQLKDQFVLEGDANTSATIKFWRQSGSPPLESAARKIIYHRGTGDVKAEGIRGGVFTPSAVDSFAPRPTAGNPPRIR